MIRQKQRRIFKIWIRISAIRPSDTYWDFLFYFKGRLGRDRSWPCGDEGANMSRLVAAPREVADKRGQVVGGRGAKATDDYTQCISAVCVFTHVTFSQMAYHVSASVSVSYHVT